MSIMIGLNRNGHNNSPFTSHQPSVKILRSKLSVHTPVAFARYPSELVFEEHLQLKRKLLQRESSSRYGHNGLNQPFRGLSRGVSQSQSRRSTFHGSSGGEQIKKEEVNSNLRRAWNQVEKAMMWQNSAKTLPFKIVKSLSARTLRRKGEVQQTRKEMQRLHQINPFGQRAVESEYLN